ncbi:MAG: hypothetical protein NTW16_13475 [Bacteroidetes bacterium]|nr:hypothetical protein [Bacteroidota bacterium]
MKTVSFFIAMILLFSSTLFGQVGVNSNNSPPDASAGLDVNFNNKGFLPPRVALTAINSAAPIAAPAIGLLVYNTASSGTPPNNVTKGYYRWNGTRWIAIESPQGASTGEMLYWNGTQWVGLPAGLNGQVLTLNNGVPGWSGIPLIIVTTTSVAGITNSSAISGGNIGSAGGSPVTARGVCWSTSPNPTTADSKTIDGSGTGIFTSNLTDLTASTLYYVRAYATNNNGTFYGAQVSFTTFFWAIGQNVNGGIVFYIDPTYPSNNVFGLKAAPSDLSTTATWGCWVAELPNFGTTLAGGTGTSIGDGSSNTSTINTMCNNPGTAAQLCSELTVNGEGGWYLPSRDELDLMLQQANLIGGFSTNDLYWSSSEYDLDQAIAGAAFIGVPLGYSGANHKASYFKVRCIRLVAPGY